MKWSHVMSRDQRSFVWMLSLRRLKRWTLPSNAASSAASSYAKACGGGGPIVGELLAIRTLSQKNSGRHLLHSSAQGVDDRLYRRDFSQSFPEASPQLQAGLPQVTVSKRRWTTVVGPRKPGCMERCVCAMARN